MSPFWRGFLKGMGSLLNLFPRYDIKNKSDAEALASDWEAVGNDMKKAMQQIDREIGEQEIQT